MILNCPSCSAKYLVASESLGDQGRDVKCAKCGHIWHQKSEKDSLDDLINRIQSEQMDEIDFGEDKSTLEESKPKKQLKQILADILSIPVRKVKSQWILLTMQLNRRFAVRLIGGSTCALILFLSIIGIAALLHNKVLHTYPQLKPLYAMVMDIKDSPVPVDIEKSLAIEHILLKTSDNGKISLNGVLINLTGKVIPVPMLSLTLSDDHKKEIFHQNLLLGKDQMEAESQHEFSVPLSEDFPANAKQLDLRFIERKTPSSEEPHHEEG